MECCTHGMDCYHCMEITSCDPQVHSTAHAQCLPAPAYMGNEWKDTLKWRWIIELTLEHDLDA